MPSSTRSRTRTPAAGKIDAAACLCRPRPVAQGGRKARSARTTHCPALSRSTLAEPEYEKMTKEAEGRHRGDGRDLPRSAAVPARPGAEEAVRQIGERLNGRWMPEAGRANSTGRWADIYGRMFQAIGGLGRPELGRLQRAEGVGDGRDDRADPSYPRKRLQLHVLELGLAIYRKMLGNTPEYLREINFCRRHWPTCTRRSAKAVPPSAKGAGAGKLILPDGFNNLDGQSPMSSWPVSRRRTCWRSSRRSRRTSPRSSRGRVACASSRLRRGGVPGAVVAVARVLRWRFDRSDPATMFFRYRTADGERGAPDRGSVWRGNPEVITQDSAVAQEDRRLARCVPTGFLRGSLSRTCLDGAPGHRDFAAAPLPDDICFYREYPSSTLPICCSWAITLRDA